MIQTWNRRPCRIHSRATESVMKAFRRALISPACRRSVFHCTRSFSSGAPLARSTPARVVVQDVDDARREDLNTQIFGVGLLVCSRQAWEALK